MNGLNTEQLLEAVLFWKSEPMSVVALAKLVGKTEAEVREGLIALRANLTARGVALIETSNEVALGTHPSLNEFFSKIEKEENETPLSKAALETLAIILYRKKISKPELDTIRGVNSQFIVRSLLVRGLIAKEGSATDGRTFIYRPTPELFSFLGITQVEDLPEYTETLAKLSAVEKEFSPNIPDAQ